MRPVRPGDRGPAVEDIQRRLRALGYDLGRAGIDGIFLGRTAEAVRAFQRELALAEDGLVGDETWSALVDETFTFGDRMLYLRLPHFHGADVRQLQHALNALGFACGKPDGIFGAFAERALREFQRNAGLPADGIFGPDTARALLALRHVWEGKDPRAHSAARLEAVRAAEVLARTTVAIAGADAAGDRVAERFVNLALATTPRARVTQVTEGEASDVRLLLVLAATAPVEAAPVVVLEGADALVGRLLTAMSAAIGPCPRVHVELGGATAEDEHAQQRAAVALLDAVCLVFD